MRFVNNWCGAPLHAMANNLAKNTNRHLDLGCVMADTPIQKKPSSHIAQKSICRRNIRTYVQDS